MMGAGPRTTTGASSATMSIAWHRHCSTQTEQPVQSAMLTP